MKINISMKTTPAEFREFLGLPEVQPLQAEMIEKIREQMQAGAEGFDPLSLMRPFHRSQRPEHGGDAARVLERPFDDGERDRRQETRRLSRSTAGRRSGGACSVRSRP